ncbi:hypothetical protein ANCCEY_14395 [Ancylostoma ceylanicum]|uniref:Helitron helicase-like domain-containing protein n=1 Tax=Ancylostoma ceylanicum TaxID=53326 RepID=A0A0D6L6N2_9BILA|nr:hypothetical protein ANCCEY_14395 [Ancylostoma ceylanicum]
MRNSANGQRDTTVMKQLMTWLQSYSEFAASSNMMGDVIREEERRALLEQRSTSTIRMVLDTASRLDRRRYNVPAASELAVVYVGEGDDVPATRSIAVHHRRGGLQCIADFDERCDPLTYPLLFPCDPPDLVAHAFNRKLEVLHDLLKRNALGRVAAYVAVMEWQKGGLPQRHMLLIMTADAKR